MSRKNNFFTPDEVNVLSIIGWYQIVGGVAGLIITGSAFTANISFAGMLIVGLILFLNGMSVLAGYQLLKRHETTLTYYIQAMQILQFVALGITCQITIGFGFGFAFEWIDEVRLECFSQFIAFFNLAYKPSHSDEIRVAVNMVPVLIIYCLLKYAERAEVRKILAGG